MSAAVDPVIQQRLAALGRRWRRLVLLRGLGGALATLLGSLILLAFLDWLVVMPDWLRWVLSAASYLGTGVLFWIVAGRFLIHAPGPKELARLAESADPQLRENLLAAVELPEGEGRWDSPAFRHLLQQAVANRVRDLNNEKVLPRAIVVRWLVAGGATAVLCVALWLVPGLRFGQMFARAAAPAANLERVSRTKIAILSPAALAAYVPRGDAIPIVIGISGKPAQTATLEVFRPGKPVESVMMLASAPAQFTGALMADEPHLQFRLRAGDAVTRKYHLATRPRPHVAQFEKNYRFPDYTRLAPKRVTDENGDLAALEDTEVELVLHVDQPVRAGVLQIQFGAGGTQIPLAPAGERKLSAKVPIKLAGTYRVKLQAAETGFDNAASPQYEIKPSADLVPRVTLLEPGRDLLVQADEQLRVVARAEDDLGLASLAQHARVNGGPWTEIALPVATNLQLVVTQQWDLAPLKARPGDQVTTKIVATDLKGNHSESQPAKITIASAGIDLRRLQSVDARKRVQDSVGELTKALRELERSASEANSRSQKGELRAGQARMGLVSQLDEAERSADAALGRIKVAISRARAGREASDLAIGTGTLAAIRHDLLGALRNNLTSFDLSSTNGPVPASEWRSVQEPIRRAVGVASALESGLATLLAAEQADVAYESVAFLVGEQARLAQRIARLQPADKDAWSEIVRRNETTARETKAIEDQLQGWSGRLPSSLGNRMKQAATRLTTARATLDKGLSSLKVPRDVAKVTAPFQKGIEGVAQELAGVKTEAMNSAERNRDAFRHAAVSALDALGQLATIAQPVTNRRKDAPPSDEELQRLWATAVAQLKSRAEIEEARPDANSEFVADLARAADALGAMQNAYGSASTLPTAAQPLAGMHKSLRLLDAARRFTETTGGLRELANQEHWEMGNSIASTGRPRDWLWLKARWNALPREWKGAGIDSMIEGRIREALASAQAGEVSREMDSRLQRRTRPVSQQVPLEQLAALLDEAARQLANTLATARDAVAQSAPKMSERMEGLARAAEALEKETAEQKQKSEQMDVPANQAKASDLLSKQEQLARQIDDVRAALRREANAQDLLNADAREKARDADDADAMLKDPPRKAADRLRDAVAAEAMTDNANSLTAANAEQKKTTDALKQLAGHFKNAEMGKAGLSRAQLRAAEEQLGMKSLMDQRYSQAAALAELAKLSPQEQMTKLEEKLKENKPMQDELSAIMKDALQAAGNTLNEAARDESTVADRLRDAAKREERRMADVATQAKRLQDDARKLANEELPRAMQSAATAQAAAEDSFLEAGKALKTAADTPIAKTEGPAEVAGQIGQMAASLREAAANLRDAANTTASAAKRAPEDKDAQAARRQTEKASTKASALAEQAKQLQQAMAPSPEANAKAVAEAGGKQGEIGKSVSEASDTLQRAARHETRLNPLKAFEMMNLSGNVEMLAKGTLPKKQQELMASPTPQAAEPPARSAQKSIEEAASAVEAAMGGAKQGQQQGQGNKSSPEMAAAQQEGKQMARALDQLDNALNQQKNGQPSQQPGQQGQQSADKQAAQAAQQAMQNMAQAQQDAARNSRQQQQATDSEGSGAEGFYAGKGEVAGDLPQAVAKGGDWGKLRPELARELMEGARDASGGEYRSMIDIYFKVIAEKARASTP